MGRATVASEDLADSLGRVARHAVLPRFTEQVAERAGVALDRSAFVLLAKLSERPWRIGELADHLNVDTSTVSRQISGLEATGLAHRQRHPEDQRGWLVIIDSTGAAALAAHRRARHAILVELLSDLPAQEIATTAAVLTHLADRLEAFIDE